jgi:hypothetical protein
MEVYGRDGRSLGVVLRVDCRPSARDLGTDTTYPLRAPQSSEPNGEAMGPAPTAALGNSGPMTQSAANGYASASVVGAGERSPDRFLIGRWAGLVGRQWVETGRIINVSLERIVITGVDL